MKKFPNRVRHYREARGISQEKLGSIVGKTKDTISKWERGKRKLKMDEAKKLAVALGVSVSEIADEVEGIHYKADENLMQQCAEAIVAAAQDIGTKLNMAQAIAYTTLLYNHVMEYRGKGKNADPDESMAALILKQSA